MFENQEPGQSGTTTVAEQPERDAGGVDSGRRTFMKLAGGVAAGTAGLSTVATEDASAGSLYWDGITLSQSGYDYAPSVMYGDGSRIKMWWCAPHYGDAIHYAELTSYGWTDPEVVLKTGYSWEWDSAHVCDPSVVKGNFYAEGSYWDYAMYYTGAEGDTEYEAQRDNKIGVAFSDDGVHWNKYDNNPVIYPKHVGSDSYGAGMPAAYRRSDDSDHVYVAFYDSTDGDQNHYVGATDGKNFGSRTTLTSDPHDNTAIGGIGYHPDEGRWYVSAKHNSDRVSYLYKTSGSWLNNTWYHLATIGGDDTGYPYNHNPCWMTWPNGNIREDGNGYKFVYLGVGESNSSTWDIGQLRYR